MKKRILSMVTALALVIALLPVISIPVSAAITVTATDIASLQTAIAAFATASDNTVITVTADMIVPGELTIPANGNAKTLTIRGDSPTRTLTRGATDDLIYVKGGSSLILENIIIDGNRDTIANAAGSLVSVFLGGELTMNAGAILRNNATSGGGGGVRNSGVFIMNGGAISGCASIGNNGKGGGVYNSVGSFIMNGGTISDCTSDDGGGVYVNGGTFTMNSGTISGCAASSGGGVENHDNFVMTGGTISGCTVSSSGVGGGVFNSSGTFNIQGSPVIANNMRAGGAANTGGVYLSNRPIAITGALTSGAKIGIEGMATTTAGTAVATGAVASDMQYFSISNADGKIGTNNFFLLSGTNIVLGTALSAVEVAITAPVTGAAPQSTVTGTGYTGTIAWSGTPTTFAVSTAYTATVVLTSTANYNFAGTVAAGGITGTNGTVGTPVTAGSSSGNTLTFTVTYAATTVGTFADLQTEIAAYATASDDKVIVVTADFPITALLTIPANANGKTLTIKSDSTTRTLTRETTGDLITVSGANSKLILENIIIDGNRGTYTDAGGSLVNVSVGGTFTMNTGATLRNNATVNGGGVSNSGTFTMTDGTISGCAAGRGGGVDNASSTTFTMTGGTISGCTADAGGGGGVYKNGGTFTMTGGTISGCTVSSSGAGGGVFNSSGTFNIQGSPVIEDNQKGDLAANTGGVYLLNSAITITGALTAGAKIGIEGTNGTTVATGAVASDVQYFDISNESGMLGTNNGFLFSSPNIVLSTLSVLNAAAVEITAPVRQATPQITVTGAGYTGTITWSGTPTTFVDLTIYTATVVLTSTAGYKFAGTVDASNITGTNGTVGTPVTTGSANSNTLTFDVTYAATGAITAANFAELQTAITNFATAEHDTVITVTADFPITELLTIPVNSNGKTLTIKGDVATRTLTRGLDGNLINIEGANSKLILENIIIDGNKVNNTDARGPLVRVVSNGTFTMNAGATLQNNANVTGAGGGVFSSAGIFVMTGGTISGCASSLGGAFFNNDGIFTMSGGTISDCTSGTGGAVYNNGTFRIQGSPVIENNKIGSGAANTGGVYLPSGKKITITGALTTGAKIGIEGMATTTTGTTVATGAVAGDLQYFYFSNAGGKIDINNSFAFSGTNIVLATLNELTTAVVTIAAPVTGAAPQNTVTGAGYTGTITWNGSPTTFAASSIYTATVVLTSTSGYKFAGTVAAGSIISTNGVVGTPVTAGSSGGNTLTFDVTYTQTAAAPIITITNQPEATTNVTAGSITGNLTVAASVAPSGTPTYQWYSDTNSTVGGGTAVVGAASASFTIPTDLTAGTYYYYCVVSATGAAEINSNMASVVVNMAVLDGTATITGTNKIGETLTVDPAGITVGSGAFSYQWKADGTDVGTNATTYTLTGAEAGKVITCVVTRADATGGITASFETGNTVPYNIVIINVGNAVGDTEVTLSSETGRANDTIALDYVLGISNTQNMLTFSGGTGLTTVAAAGASVSQSYTVNASDAINGAISITATFQHTAKSQQTIAFASGNQTKTYGDASFTNAATLSGTGGTGEISYASSDTLVATVDSSGTVTIVGAGTATITATKAEDTTYAETTAIYTVTVNKATITITAENKSTYVGDAEPAYTYTVTGIIGSDILATVATLTSAPIMTAADTYTITPSGAAVPTGGNYNTEIIYVSGTLTVSVRPSGGGSSGGGSTVKPTTTTVLVDGVPVNIGTTTVSDNNTTVAVDQTALNTHVNGATDNVTVIVPSTTNTASAQLVLENIEKMAEKKLVLFVLVDDVSYSLPTNAVDTKSVLQALGTQNSSVVVVNISVTTKVDAATLSKAQNSVDALGGQIVIPAMQFTMTATYNGKTVEIDTFSSYVSHVVEITAEQAARITTAVIVEADGTTRHVPTKVYQKDGKWYAEINSLTNSTYVLIYNEQSFADVNGKWFAAVANEMASRKIINGVSDTEFAGERSITRAEFAAIVVAAMGLPANATSTSFSDVPVTAWYAGAANTAYEYGIISGRENGEFDPNANITRQEAMIIMQNAAKLANFSGTIGSLTAFPDNAEVASWAESAVQFCVGSGIVSGSNGNLLPTSNISRAESAAIILRLLQKVELLMLEQ